MNGTIRARSQQELDTVRMDRIMAMLRVVISATCIAVLSSTALATQETPRTGRKGSVSVEADITRHLRVSGRVTSSTGRYYRAADGRVREDVGPTGLVVDPKARTATLLSHEARRAQIVVLAPEAAPRPPLALPIRFGDGVHEGRRITKSRMSNPAGGKSEIWMDEELGLAIMIRTESANQVSTKTLRNIRVREPDSSVFAVPVGYTTNRTVLSAAGLAGTDVSSLLQFAAGRGR